MYVLKRRPKLYPCTEQQALFRRALEFCGIQKGVSKRELMEKMRECIPQFFRSEHEKAQNLRH